jgi:PAS domain S-box-containing protein
MARAQSSAARSGSETASPHSHGKISGDGEMAELVRSHDWDHTSLGPIDDWPETLLSCLNTILASRFPMALAWGREMLQFYNDAYCPLMAEKHPRALGRPAAESWEEAWHIVGPELEGALLRGEATYREKVLIPMRRGGQLQDVYWTYSNSPVYTPSGEIVGVLSACHDITGEILATRERDTVTKQLNQALEATADAVVSVNRDWRISYVNPMAKQVLADYGDVIGRLLWEVFPHIGFPGSSFVEHYRRAMEQGVGGEFEGYYPEPFNVWVNVHVRPTKDGIVIFFRDITAQKETERIAREASARLDAMCNTSLEYMGLVSPEGKLLDCNRASLEFGGNTREELIGKWFWECPWFAHTPGAPEMAREVMARAVSGEHIRFEWPLVRPTGDILVFDFSVSPVRDLEGKVILLVPEGRDITSLKRAESALKKNEKLAAVGRLAASIAHEINNPLEAVTNLLFLALESADPGQVHRYIQAAERELRRVSIISNQTLRFHKQSTNPKFVRSDELLHGVIAAYQARIMNGGVRVEERLRAQEPLYCFDGEIRQALNSLIGNAIDAMRTEGGRLLVRSREGTGWRSGHRCLILTIADTGHGISPENRDRIFEPFFTTKGIGGTGLGLWVTQEIAERHQGWLRVRSAEAKGRSGAVFNLVLPFDGVARQNAA